MVTTNTAFASKTHTLHAFKTRVLVKHCNIIKKKKEYNNYNNYARNKVTIMFFEPIINIIKSIIIYLFIITINIIIYLFI